MEIGMNLKRNSTCFPTGFSICDWSQISVTGNKTRGGLAQCSKGIVNA